VPHAEWAGLGGGDRAALLAELRRLRSAGVVPGGLLLLDNASAAGPFGGWCGEALEEALPEGWAVCIVVRSEHPPADLLPAWPAAFRRWLACWSVPAPHLRASHALAAALQISGQRFGQPAAGTPVRPPLPAGLCDAPDVVELLQQAWQRTPLNDGLLAERAWALRERQGPRLLPSAPPAAAAAAPAAAHIRLVPGR